MSWHTMSRIEPGLLQTGSSVTAVPRAGDLVDLFAIAQDGAIYTAHGSATTEWTSWSRVDAAFKGDSPVTAVARDQDRVDLFVTAGGVVYWTHRTGADTFAAYRPVYPSFNRARSQVSAIARGTDQIDLFVTTFDGEIFTTYWDSVKQKWSSWTQIDPNFSKASYFNKSAVVSRHADSMELFVTGTNGLVYQASRQAMTPWTGLAPVPDDGSFATAGSEVAAISRDADHIDLFVVGFNNRIYNNSWETNRGWVTWQFIDADFKVQQRAPLTVVSKDPGRLDVFVASGLDSIRSTVWEADTGWRRWWDWIDYQFERSGEAASVQWIGTERMELFVASNDPIHDGGVFCTYWDPVPAILRRARIDFQTHDDDKDSASLVHVFVKNRASNSLTPEAHADLLPNLFDLPRYASGGDLSYGKRNPYLAVGLFLGAGIEFDDPGHQSFELEIVAPDISVNDIILPEVDICFVNDKGALAGYDKWIFDYSVSLIFDDGPLQFSSTHNGGGGIVMDENNRTHSGIGIENYRRTVPVLETPKATTDAVLYSVALEFYTHLNGDNKDADTSIDVRISNRVNESVQDDIARGVNLFSNDEFPDDGDDDHPEHRYRSITWSRFETMSYFAPIRLADVVLPMIAITINPHGVVGYDTWMFDYQLTLEFGDPTMTTEPGKLFRYSWRRTGVILDQDNRTHVAVYQGTPFPTVSPPTRPSMQPLNADFMEASISIAFLQSKLEEFINNRAVPHTGPDTGSLPPLFKIHLGSVGQGEDYPFPESYADVQGLVNGDDGEPRYISAVRSLGQLTAWAGIGNAYIRSLDCDDIYLNVYADRTPPLEVTLSFTSGGSIQTHGDGRIDILTLTITLKLTLVRGTIANPFNGIDTVIDLFSWAPAYIENRDDNSDLLDQYIEVNLITASAWDFGDIFRGKIRDTIANTLTAKDPFTARTLRDELNSQVTSWLVGGISDGAYNTDDNNVRIRDVQIQLATPTDPGSEDRIVITYRGPQNGFVPPLPSGWPPPDDFGASNLDNIKHIVVLMKENRSFDHLLGYLSLPIDQGGLGRNDVDGLHGDESNVYKGQTHTVFPLDHSRVAPGPPNGYEATHQAINCGQMDGFVRSHADLNNDAVAPEVMGYYTGSRVWAYDSLARDFAIGHRWFASHPGPTFPNRFYALTGRPNLDVNGIWEFNNSSPVRPVFTQTIFDALEDATDRISGEPVTWRYFEHGYCTLRFFQRFTFNHDNIVDFDDPVNGFLAAAASGQLPSVSFIDPHFVDYPPGSNCDEPPGDIADGQELVDEIVQAVVSSPQWNQTLLLIVYDEHGGFFDHVPPRIAPKVSDEMPIETVGARVPAFVVSPWVSPGSAFGADDDTRIFDHTSILKTIARRFLTNPPYLGARYAAANDLASVIGTQLHTPQFLPYLRYRFQFVKSQGMLDAGSAIAEPGTALRHMPANGSDLQEFCLEDAGQGWFYIRIRANGLYVSVQTSTDATDESTPVMLGQDRRYSSSNPATGDSANSDAQKWMFSLSVSSSSNERRYVISNKAYANRVMGLGAEDTVVLGQADDGNDGWFVTCPRLDVGTTVG